MFSLVYKKLIDVIADTHRYSLGKIKYFTGFTDFMGLRDFIPLLKILHVHLKHFSFWSLADV